MARRGQAARAAGTVSVAVFISRILGVVREMVFAKLFGATLYNDAWQVAFRIPNLLRDLFAEGALSSAFVPTFSEHVQKKSKSEAFVLTNLVLSGLLMVLGAFGLLLFLFSPVFVHLLAPGYAEVPGKTEITSVLTRILSPFLLLVAMASVSMGVLNAFGHFFLPALAPAFFNVALILTGFFLAPQFERWGIQPINAMAAGALLGGLLQYAVQIPLLRRHGYSFRFRINLQHEGLRRMGRLMAPAIVGISATEINIVVNTQLASFLGDGPVSWLSYAFRILYLPIGLFGVAIGGVNLREVSVFAAQERWEDFRETVANSIKLLALVAIPSTVGLMLLARPIVDVLLERGEFKPRDTGFTSYALMAYALGLFAYSAIKVYGPSFYALNDTRTPMRASMTAVGANIVTNVFLIWILPDRFKYVGLAFGTAVSVTLNNALLARNFRRRLGSLERYHVTSAILKNCAAALAMGIVVYLLHRSFEAFWPDMDSIGEVVALGGSIALGVFVYFGACYLLGVEEIDHLLKRLRR